MQTEPTITLTSDHYPYDTITLPRETIAAARPAPDHWAGLRKDEIGYSACVLHGSRRVRIQWAFPLSFLAGEDESSLPWDDAAYMSALYVG